MNAQRRFNKQIGFSIQKVYKKIKRTINLLDKTSIKVILNSKTSKRVEVMDFKLKKIINEKLEKQLIDEGQLKIFISVIEELIIDEFDLEFDISINFIIKDKSSLIKVEVY